MVPIDEAHVVEKGALGPGQIAVVDMQEGRLYHDTEIKDKLAASQPFGEWVGRITELDSDLAEITEAPLFTRRGVAQAPDRGGIFDRRA